MPIDKDKYTVDKDGNIISETIIAPSTLETIDQALYNWVDKEANIFSTTNKGWKKSPVIWMSSERSHQVKNRKELRDDNGALILPLITVSRTSVTKDPQNKGIFQANIPPVADYRGGSITVNRRINQDKTANFANADVKRKGRYAADGQAARDQITFPSKNEKIVYQSMSIPLPVYVDVEYDITLRTEYQQQMNEMVTPFVTKTGGVNHFLLESDGHRFEGFIDQNFSQENNISTLQADERMYQTTVKIKILGYLIGEGKNQAQPKVVIRENAVEVKIPREHVIFGDIPENLHVSGNVPFYRE